VGSSEISRSGDTRRLQELLWRHPQLDSPASSISLRSPGVTIDADTDTDDSDVDATPEQRLARLRHKFGLDDLLGPARAHLREVRRSMDSRDSDLSTSMSSALAAAAAPEPSAPVVAPSVPVPAPTPTLPAVTPTQTPAPPPVVTPVPVATVPSPVTPVVRSVTPPQSAATVEYLSAPAPIAAAAAAAAPSPVPEPAPEPTLAAPAAPAVPVPVTAPTAVHEASLRISLGTPPARTLSVAMPLADPAPTELVSPSTHGVADQALVSGLIGQVRGCPCLQLSVAR
jgi:hypothetical protein